MTITPSPDQQVALNSLSAWFAKPTRFTELTGLAGTGKTTLLKLLPTLFPQYSFLFMAPTGKAAHIQRIKGLTSATIHSTIFDALLQPDGTYSFSLKSPTTFFDIDFFIVDEASMVSKDLHEALLSFSIPILYVGDHGQLEPVDPSNPNPFNLLANPAIRLEKIHRQAANSPIISFAHHLRSDQPAPSFPSQAPTLSIAPASSLSPLSYPNHQIICATNKTRINLNQMIRPSIVPDARSPLCIGDRLIFLTNNQELGTFNGMQGTVTRILSPVSHRTTSGSIEAEIQPDFDSPPITLPLYVPTLISGSVSKPSSAKQARYLSAYAHATYAYAITCHKSQGSEWPNVIVLDECGSWCPWSNSRWRYTAATRASHSLTWLH